MKTTQILVGIVILAVLALGGWYIYSKNDTDQPSQYPTTKTPDSSATPTTPTTTTAPKNGTLKAAFSRGGNYTCTFMTIADNGKTTGTLYSTATASRLDMKVDNKDGTNVTTHVVKKSGYAYTWVEGGQPVGIKTALTATSKIIPQPTGATISVDENSQISSDCHAWLPDATLLTPPSQITFIAQ